MKQKGKELGLRKFWVYVGLAVLFALPGCLMRLAGFQLNPILDSFIFGLALLGAGFLLSWGAEAAEEHASQGLVLAGLALVTVLPEYAIDIYYTLKAGQQPGSEYVGFAAANMTGANRLLIGTAWPLIVLLFWWRSGKRTVQLRRDNLVEIVFLTLGSLYSFFITFKGAIDLFDMVVLLALFGLYIWRVSHLPKKQAEDDDDGAEEEIEVGPAASLEQLPKVQQYSIIAGLTIVAALIILIIAEPFAESLVTAGSALGIDKFLLIQWIAPLAGETPEIIITILFTLSLRPTPALGALVSDKINQWTLLVGMIPLFYSIGLGRAAALPLDARQHEEFFLTASQSLFAVALLLHLQLSLRSGLTLLGLFLVQLGLGFIFRDNEAAVITSLTYLAWFYLVMAIGLFLWNYRKLLSYLKIGLYSQAELQTDKDREWLK